MAQVRSHYENLKVARDAPAEVIRAAYRALAQKYHPDRNSSVPDAGRIMTIVNEAYAVLSDPKSRLEYDARLAAAERETGGTASMGQFTYGTTRHDGDADNKSHRKPATNADGTVETYDLEKDWQRFSGFFKRLFGG